MLLDSGPQVVIDYSQPIQAVVPPGNLDEPTGLGEALPPLAPDIALADFDAAREAFQAGDYEDALQRIHRVLGATPNDPSAHEFRALILFAEGEYREAAAAIHAVLSIGPGWDWPTMSGLYPSVDRYTHQLRQLEAFRNQNPDAAYVHFLLAYHYMTTGYTKEAIREFRLTSQLEPSDALAKNLLEMLENSGTSIPTNDMLEEAIPALPEIPQVDPNSLFGHWTAPRGDNASIALTLNPDGTFLWTFTNGDRRQEMKGQFSIAGDTLALESEAGGPMIGTIRRDNESSFHFRAVGAGPGDPGLQFSRSQ